jgi:hypothetical protein
MRKAVFDPHIPASKRLRFTGIRNALSSTASFRVLSGHYPYGVHRLYGIDDPRYFVMLREPIDRAISHYFFIQACDGPDYRHPRLDDARSENIVGLYQKPAYQNMQTRFVAGLGWEYAGRFLNLNDRLGQWALSRAKFHLTHRYDAFGLQDRFQDSAQLFADRIEVNPHRPKKRHKRTPDRPTPSDLSNAATGALQRANALDVALHRFAVEHFEVQFDE